MIAIILYILLEVMPIASIWGIMFSAITLLLGFLLRDAYLSLKKRLEIAETENAALKAQLAALRLDLKKEIDALRLELEKSNREHDENVNELKDNILNRLDSIRDRFDEFRK